jgi:hypothetical protein
MAIDILDIDVDTDSPTVSVTAGRPDSDGEAARPISSSLRL